MGDHGRGIGGKGPGRRPAERGAAVADPGADRPGAAGHRFGPRLVCSECGIRWDVHQRDPQPCTAELPPDPFSRRPVVPVAAGLPLAPALSPALSPALAPVLSPPLAPRVRPRPVVVALPADHERDGEP